LHGSKRSALVYLVVGLVSVMIMATNAATRLPLQPLTVRRAAFAPHGFSVCIEGCPEYLTLP
jgi:hypothetical protein